jgi:hypothetical protein
MANINTLKTLGEAQAKKSEDPWGFALQNFSTGSINSQGDKYFVIPQSLPLREFVQRFPSASYASIEEVNTPVKTVRTLYLHDHRHRIIFSTRDVELIGDEIHVAKLRPPTESYAHWAIRKLFGSRLRTRADMRRRAHGTFL